MAFKSQWKKRAAMTGGIFTVCINSTDSLIPLLGPSGGPNSSAMRWCITVGVTNIFGLEVLVVCWFRDDMSLGCLKTLIIALSEKGSSVPIWSMLQWCVPERKLLRVWYHYICYMWGIIAKEHILLWLKKFKERVAFEMATTQWYKSCWKMLTQISDIWLLLSPFLNN